MASKITGNELFDAYRKYRQLTGLARNQNSARKFMEFLGEESGVFKDKLIHEDAARKIKWLNGPHAITMYKAWEAQNERKGDT